jgi:hypothetical protein
VILHRMPSLGVSSLDLGRFRAASFLSKDSLVAQASCRKQVANHSFGDEMVFVESALLT